MSKLRVILKWEGNNDSDFKASSWIEHPESPEFRSLRPIQDYAPGKYTTSSNKQVEPELYDFNS